MLTTLYATGHWWTLLQSYYYPLGKPHTPSLVDWLEIIGDIIFLFLALIFLTRLKDGRNATGHWSHHFADLQMSSQEFYTQIEEIITGMNEPHIKTKFVVYSEGGFITANRTYLRVSRGDILFDICAAPFGTGFFISWWQADKDFLKRFLLALPLIGRLMERAFYPHTYYHVDSREMFQATIHEILLSAIDALIIEKGLRGLTELERIPNKGKLQPRAVAF